jgi:predicted nucleic acid-binding protein
LLRVEFSMIAVSDAGQRFGIVDLLIAATAHEHGASVWSLNSDFERFAKLRFIKLRRPQLPRRR